MGANVWPVDAVSGAPSYTGRILRQNASAWAINPSRPLCGRSGVAAGTPTTIATATSTTWTVTPFKGVIDGETSAVAGSYNFSFDSNQSNNNIVAADATNPRVDLLYVRVSDPAEGDGTSVPVIELLYLAGTPAASPSAPATPARSFALATILVPKVGGGSPAVSFVAPLAVAAGGVQPCLSSATYPASPYVGHLIYDQALKQMFSWNGTAWRPYFETNSLRQAGGATSLTVPSGNVATGVNTFNGGTDYNIGNITYGTGIFTVLTPGLYRWDASAQFTPSASDGTYRLAMYVRVSGVHDTGGQQSVFIDTSVNTVANFITSGFAVQCIAGDTFQLFFEKSGAGANLTVLATHMAVTRIG